MHIAIIGNGISGITAARFIRKFSDHRITVISNETDHFFSRTALMYIYMGHLRYEDTKPYEDHFWSKNRIELKKGFVQKVDTEKKSLIFDNEELLHFDKLIIACGSKPNRIGWPGESLEGVQGLYHYQDLESMERYSEGLKRAVIVGGGLIGIEMAEMFHSRHIPVTLLVREKSYWGKVLPPEESEMVNQEIFKNGIDLRLGQELAEILDDGNGKVGAIRTKSGETIDCGFVGLTIGVRPNIDFLKKSNIDTNRGILVDEFLTTSIPDIYAVGDCAELRTPTKGRRPIEAIWYTGRMMGETVAHTICKKPTIYQPKLWFNSAKFFDIEYQVYGDIQALPPTEHSSIFWQLKNGKKSIRIVYHNNHLNVLGFNLMGIRYRQEVCEKWINEKTNIETVLQSLSLANFDPEFFQEYEPALIQEYNQQTGKNIQLKKARGWDSVFSFLKKN